MLFHLFNEFSDHTYIVHDYRTLSLRPPITIPLQNFINPMFILWKITNEVNWSDLTTSTFVIKGDR